MAKYVVKILPHLEDDIVKIPEPFQSTIRSAIKALATQPRPAGMVKMSGYADVYRVRVGKYRLVYVILDNELLVIVIAAASRGAIYPLTKRRMGKWRGKNK